jgi:hypothetical protein
LSTRPYATHGGLRIRQCYNRRLIEYRQRCNTTVGVSPIGVSCIEWDRWVQWTRDREAALLANRDELIKQAEQREKEKRNARKRTNRRG